MADAFAATRLQLSVPHFLERWNTFVQEGQNKSSEEIVIWLSNTLQTMIAPKDTTDRKALGDALKKLGILFCCIWALISPPGSDFCWENALLALYGALCLMPLVSLAADLELECATVAGKRAADQPAPVSSAECYFRELIAARSPTSYLSLLPRDILRFVRLSPAPLPFFCYTT